MRRRELKGFKDFKTLDNYIQNCLDLYKIMSPLQEYYDIAGKYSKYIISNKSTIPDLVIYNTKFNKNDCFYDYYGKNYNDFPRVKFILNSKSSKNKIKKKKEEINLNLNDNTKRVENGENKNINENDENKNKSIEENKIEKNEEFNNENVEKIQNENVEKIQNEKEEKIKNKNEEKKEEEKEKIRETKKENEKENEKEEEKQNEEKEEINEDDKDDMNDEDYDLTNPYQFFAQIQNNKVKLTKEPSNNNINEINEEKEIKEEEQKQEEKKKEEIKEKEKKEELKEEKKQIKKNILINPKTQNNIIEAETASLTFIETKKPKNENNQNQNLNSNQINNNNNNQNEKPKIQMINPQMNIPMINPLMYMQNPFMTNPTLSVPFNYTMMNHINYMNFQNDDDDEDDDPMLNNFNDDFSKYNPSIFLEKPALIVKKNLFDKNWILMRNNKVVFNFNSEELFYYLGEQIRYGNKFENISICDFQTDLFFIPSNLFDILRNTVPKLKKMYLQQKMKEYNLNKNHMFMMNNNSKFNSGKK